MPATKIIRVAFVATNLRPAGAERQMVLLAQGLPRESFQVRFLLLSERGALADEAEAHGIAVHTLGMSREACRMLRPGCLRSAGSALRAYRTLTRGVDIIDAWTVPAYTLAGLARPFASAPVVIAGRRSQPDVHRTRTRLRELMRSVAMRHMDAVVANSQAAATAAVKVEHIDPARIRVIRNAVVQVDTPPDVRVALRQSWHVSDEDVVVACIATLQVGKGHDLILKIASRLRHTHPELHYVFVGDGPLRESIESDIRSSGLKDIVTIESGQSDARQIYGAFEIVIQASVSEGLPNAVLEAAAAGRAIIATNVGGTSEVITSEREGILVKKESPGEMEAALVRLAGDPELRTRLGAAAQERARNFSLERLVAQTSALYEQLVDRARRRSP